MKTNNKRIKKLNNISALIIAKNAEDNIKKCLKTLKKTNIENIILIDDFSTDKTPKIAENLGSIIFRRHLNNNFAAQKNFGLTKTHSDWVFILDSDESLSPHLISFLSNFAPKKYSEYSAISFKRQDFFLNKKLKHGENAYLFFPRLVNRKNGKFVRKVHETWQSNFPVLPQKNLFFTHHPHPNLKSFFQKINYYSTLRAQELKEKGESSHLFQIIFYPPAKFLQNYLFRLGFLDGMPGLIMALGMSLHSFLTHAKSFTQK